MLLLTIALATTHHESSEALIESYLGNIAEAKMTLRRALEKSLTGCFVDADAVLEDEEIVVPFISCTNVEGFGAHD
jgi:hypothetical protein